MQSEKDKIMELLTITEVKEGGEVIFTDRSIEILQELGQQYKETPLFKKSRQDTRIGRGMPTQAYYSCICVKD